MANGCDMLQRELESEVARESGDSRGNYKISLAVSFFFKFFNLLLSKTLLKKVFIISLMVF